MEIFIGPLAELAEPWANRFGDSVLLQALVTFVHFSGLLVAGGVALSADAAVRRGGRGGWKERVAVARELGSAHRVVIGGLAAVVASGFLLLTADVEALLPSPVFWAKMAGFGLLLGNGVALQRAERAVAALAFTPAPPEEVLLMQPAGFPYAESAAGPAIEPPPPPQAEGRWRTLRRAALRSAGLWFLVLFLGTLLTLAA